MNRGDLQALSKERVKDARTLLTNKRFAAAYYLAGYAVECALKACIAKRTKRHDFPDKRLALDSHTHDLAQLLNISGLKLELDKDMTSNRALAANWLVVKDWNESKRYERSVSRAEAKDLYSAITARKNGVLGWLKRRW